MLLGGLVSLGCATGSNAFESGGGYGGVAGGAPGGGTGGASPCAEDCSAMPGIPVCYEGVCDTSKDPPMCAIEKSSPETECDDGAFCTLGDHCQDGVCIPGTTPNDCGGQQGDQCNNVACNEASDSCQLSPKPVGSMCTPSDLCQTSGQCNSGGQCVGVLNTCLWTVVDDCHIAVCDPNDGQCKPQPAHQGLACDADLCHLGGICDANGACLGATLKDCSYLDNINCLSGVCDVPTGNCVTQQGQEGDPCSAATDGCNDGICDAQLVCVAHPRQNGTHCDDFNSCTDTDLCTAGVCAGTPIANCTTYFEQSFDAGCPPVGWTLNPDWECGTPSVAGPAAAHSGTLCLGTIIGGYYFDFMTYDTAYAQTPPFGLPSGSDPVLTFWAWWQTSTYWDGWNVEISTDNGATFAVVPSPTPAYTEVVSGLDAWNGDESAAGWQPMQVSLAPYVGQNVILRFAFEAQSGGGYAGAYVDDVQVREAATVPLVITNTALPAAVVDSPYNVQLMRSGGSSAAQWSIVPGGVNDGWLSIDPATGLLSGTPTSGNLGSVTVTIHVEEPSQPSNFDESTFSFNVISALYFQSFDGVCPNGWTLTGEWQCGTPSVVGPATAYSPPQCIATVISGYYSNGDQWAANTATSPSIDLTSAVTPQVTWRMWLWTEGSIFDGANLKVSTDGGVSWQIVSTVVPAYTLNIAGETAWGGDQSALGWQEFTADLSAYVGQPIMLRFAFQSDGSVVYPGVYIDDLLVTG